jgi:hypothetical protein
VFTSVGAVRRAAAAFSVDERTRQTMVQHARSLRIHDSKGGVEPAVVSDVTALLLGAASLIELDLSDALVASALIAAAVPSGSVKYLTFAFAMTDALAPALAHIGSLGQLHSLTLVLDRRWSLFAESEAVNVDDWMAWELPSLRVLKLDLNHIRPASASGHLSELIFLGHCVFTGLTHFSIVAQALDSIEEMEALKELLGKHSALAQTELICGDELTNHVLSHVISQDVIVSCIPDADVVARMSSGVQTLIIRTLLDRPDYLYDFLEALAGPRYLQLPVACIQLKTRVAHSRFTWGSEDPELDPFLRRLVPLAVQLNSKGVHLLDSERCILDVDDDYVCSILSASYSVRLALARY